MNMLLVCLFGVDILATDIYVVLQIANVLEIVVFYYVHISFFYFVHMFPVY